MMNAALMERSLQHNAVMVPMHVRPGDLAAVVAGIRRVQNFRGAIITMPYKVSIFSLLDEVRSEAKQVGACNVIRLEKSGRLVGAMFDGEGLVMSLRRAGHEIRGKRLLLIGSGGAAAGIAFAVCKHEASSLTIQNRTAERVVQLAHRLKAEYPTMPISVEDSGGPYDVIINATSLGMTQGDPLPMRLIPRDDSPLAVDIVISQEATPFLSEATKAGYQSHDGIAMLSAQMQMMLDFFEL